MTTFRKVRTRIFTILETSDREDFVTELDDIILIGLIILNTFAVVLETVESIYEPYKFWFDAFELFSIIVFTVEYFLRLWVCVENIGF